MKPHRPRIGTIDPARWGRIVEILDNSLELAGTERSEYVGRACSGDPELRAQVEALIAADRAAGVLEHPALEWIPEALVQFAKKLRKERMGVHPGRSPSGSSSGDSERTTRTSHGTPGQHEIIGNYRLLEQIGSGGMGDVYRAEQTEPIQRTVAVKVIKRGMDTKEVIARFEAESQALALMDHPNIAKVFDAGSTSRGRPYFIMEYVKGVPITTYCDTQKLTIHERLELFIQLCEGAQHAHQKAIIHRDLKPSNVLVTIQDETAVLKIIDFGVAKATAQKLTEKTMYTALGELIGTPEYMSPEQAEMTGTNVDTRTDVYSLGVILYVLLVGALPFDPHELRNAGFEGIVRMIRQQDPPRPSTKLSTLGERKNEVAAARRTAPDRLGRVLRGDLDWITMRALEKNRTRRYGSAVELAADVRRHLQCEPVLARPPSAVYRTRKFVRRHRVGVGIAALLTVLLTGFALTMVVQAGRTATERDRANAEAKTAREVTEFLVSSFEVADPREARGDEITAREILERGADRIDRELQDQPLLRAQMMDTMGRVYQQLRRLDRAEDLLEGALELRRTELGERHADVAKSMSRLGFLRVHQGRRNEGRQLQKQALSIQQDLLGPDHVDTAWSLFYLGSLEGLPKGRELLERARSIFEQREGPRSMPVAWCWQNLALKYQNVGDNANALNCARRALEIKERIHPPDHWDLAFALESVGLGLAATEDFTTAVEYISRAREIYAKTFGEDDWETLRSTYTLGRTLRKAGRFEEAKPHIEQALTARRRTSDVDDALVGFLLGELGILAHHAGRYAEAGTVYAEALPILDEALGPDAADVDFVEHLEHYAITLRELGQATEAASLEVRAKAMREKIEKQRVGN